jgi:uncharacterized membrane protein
VASVSKALSTRSRAGLPLGIPPAIDRVVWKGGWFHKVVALDAPWHHRQTTLRCAMTSTDPVPRQPAISNTQLALAVYVLYFIGYFTGITAIVGVIIAHVQHGSGDPLLDSHYRFQIRTFWIGVLYFIVGTILLFVLVGFLVYAWWVIWSLVRNVKGILALNENRPIANPGSWMFG